MGLNLRLMQLNSNFQHLSKNELMDAYRNSNRRLLFFDYEGTIQEDSTNQNNDFPVPSQRLIKLLTALSADSKNLIFIVSGRDRKSLSQWFSSVPNIGLAAEHGFFYRFGKNMNLELLNKPFTNCNGSFSPQKPVRDKDMDDWHELFNIKDWSWKESVLRILEGFTEKTEGSSICEKESTISWFYGDCDIYFGNVQANEIKTHLQNIFENCKLDFVNGKDYLEIKPQNVNKGYFLSQVLIRMFQSKSEPDFIFTIGDGISDEEMFNYINSVQNSLSYLNEKMKIFTCTIGRKPSAAKYYLNEIHEVLENLEALNQTHHFKKELKARGSTRHISEIKYDFRPLGKNISGNSISAFDIHSLTNLHI